MDNELVGPDGGPPSAGKTKGPRKGRRWSLDIISPFFQPRKRSSAPSYTLDAPSMERRLSATLPQPISGGSPIFGLSFPWRRTRRTSEHDAFIVVHPREEDPIVVSVAKLGDVRCQRGRENPERI